MRIAKALRIVIPGNLSILERVGKGEHAEKARSLAEEML